MFGAPSSHSGAKRKAGEDADDEGVDEITEKVGTISMDKNLLKNMAKLLLQHEDSIRVNSRDDNVVLEIDEKHMLFKAMEDSSEAYQKEGTKAREEAATNGTTFMGNPQGKKPDALFRSLLFHIGKHLDNLQAKIAEQQPPPTPQLVEALDHLVSTGSKAPQKDSYQSSRCFKVPVRDSAKVRWIFAASRHPDVIASFRTVMKHKDSMDILGFQLCDDFAPRSRAAKAIEATVFAENGSGASSGKGNGKKKQRAKAKK